MAFFESFLKYIEKNGKFNIKLPLPGMGCGVLGLAFKNQTINMGKVASMLLKSLEYRGYDSTGAAIQDDKGDVSLRKDVGAPSLLVKTLGIEDMEGKLFCGQVRWATFGSVDKTNAQPHIVKCKRYIYGAHNGNITNTNFLKQYLTDEGHTVLSDNDGEMLIHIIEHYFDQHLDIYAPELQEDTEIRRGCMRKAIVDGCKKTEGSFAAVIVDPVTEYLYCIKSGSSLYAGIGNYEDNPFVMVSSDLTSILKFTKDMIPLIEGMFMEFNSSEYQVFTYKNLNITDKEGNKKFFEAGKKIDVKISRSKLRAEDTELIPPYKFFMHQEIAGQVESTRKLITLFMRGSQDARKISSILSDSNLKSYLMDSVENIVHAGNYQAQLEQYDIFKHSDEGKKIISVIKENFAELISRLSNPNFINNELYSQFSNLFLDLIEGRIYKGDHLLAVKILDAGEELRELEKFHEYLEKFADVVYEAWNSKSDIYTISCGTSYNATKTAALFFNEICGIKITPLLPGNFRGQYSNTLRDGDVLIGVSQSGETKDLIDIFNDVIESGKKIKRIAIVNNENSTMAQEKSEFFLPIKCGPEIAVPATKSYMNQAVLFYYLAIITGNRKLDSLEPKSNEYKHLKAIIEKRMATIELLPKLISETIKSTESDVEKLADFLYHEPSMHILATKISSIAEEGALKIRETVLNHTQGMEASEFKHGPNTILGFNTVFGIKEIEKVLKFNRDLALKIIDDAVIHGLAPDEIKRVVSDASEYIIDPVKPFNISPKGMEILEKNIGESDLTKKLYDNYPLIYITGPDERDVNLTISQINTHKIRGANTYVIAEENNYLYDNATKVPSGVEDYKSIFVRLPRTDDTLMSTFSSMVVLQLLALKMSIKKMKYLNKLHIPLHGVHPDVPKNVSKSITVD
ncbi:MAG: SIS domain-containing protein [Candidatus Delongbacteria bacterium]|nr:SIS domain-containing protein [Candidatus Delongbacteria bacterium]MBN2833880.1 SIS domain-containing protein [Candidatus Delongbacteria bacterium]